MSIISQLQEALGKDKVLCLDKLCHRYNHIWKMDSPLKAEALVMPSNTEEVATICKLCYEHNREMVVFGGLTNLVGATATQGNEIVISLEKLNKIESIDPDNKTMIVQSGVILEQIHKTASDNDLFFPLSFGAKGSCQIGGCISTNAGGIRVLRYGMTRNQVLGLEVVLPSGKILSSMKQMLKDNTGYDLKHLFVGAEGTLGIITRAILRLRENMISRQSAFVAFDDFSKVPAFLKFIDKGLAGQLSAFEFIENETYQALTAEGTPWKPPLPHGYPYYVLIESLGADNEKDREALINLLEQAMLKENIVDGAIAMSEKDLDWFWNIREDVSILAKKYPYDQHFDVSLPLKHMENYIANVKDRLKEIAEVKACFVFGHLADGNMHFVIGKSSNDGALKSKINDIVYLPLSKIKGSVSAEHGIGLDKKAYLSTSRSTEEIETMTALKTCLDPKSLLNKGRIFD